MKIHKNHPISINLHILALLNPKNSTKLRKILKNHQKSLKTSKSFKKSQNLQKRSKKGQKRVKNDPQLIQICCFPADPAAKKPQKTRFPAEKGYLTVFPVYRQGAISGGSRGKMTLPDPRRPKTLLETPKNRGLQAYFDLNRLKTHKNKRIMPLRTPS